MDINVEYINPFDEKYDYFMRVEHLGRYYFASKLLKDFNNVLDIACADGYGVNLLSKHVSNVVGIDRKKEYLSIAKRRYKDPNISFIEMDVDINDIQGMYDGIVCFETIEHVKYPDKLLNNLYNILEDNGILILSVPNSKYEVIENGKNKDTYHLHVFDINELKELITSIGFNIVDLYGQSYINKIVNKDITNYYITNVSDDAKIIGFPNKEDIEKTYSYIFVLKK